MLSSGSCVLCCVQQHNQNHRMRCWIRMVGSQWKQRRNITKQMQNRRLNQFYDENKANEEIVDVDTYRNDWSTSLHFTIHIAIFFASNSFEIIRFYAEKHCLSLPTSPPSFSHISFTFLVCPLQMEIFRLVLYLYCWSWCEVWCARNLHTHISHLISVLRCCV